MQYRHLLFLLVFFTGLISDNTLSAECKLTELAIVKTTCNDGKFAVKINFKSQEVSHCFKVSGNGNNYGTYEYSQLPIIIDGLKGDCVTDYEFVITDCENDHCSVAKGIGKVCCPPSTDCKIFDLRLEREPCDTNDLFYAYLNFKFQNTSSCFKLKINGHLINEYSYSSLPIKIGPLEGDCQTARLFEVVDCDAPDCFGKIEMEKVCCNKCSISKIKIEKTDCDTNNLFYAHVSFNAENVSDSFFIKVNDKLFGKFKYGNPSYKVGPFPGDCITKYKFLIFDEKDNHCAEDTLWGPVCCNPNQEPCKLSELVVEKTNCNSDDQFFLHIDFKHSNTSDCFYVIVSGDTLGHFLYSDLPLREVGPFKGDCVTDYKILIADCQEPRCALDKYIGKVCCNAEPCLLDDLNLVRNDCDANGMFTVTINFQHKNTSECFKVFVNGIHRETFKYIDLPVTVGPLHGDCITNYNFVIKDCEKPDCNLERSIGKVCCNPSNDCKLSELEVGKSDCNNDNQFFLNLNFHHANTSDCFYVIVNGDTIGQYPYSALPLREIGPFNGDCHTEYKLIIVDCKDPHCAIDKNFGKVCCPNTDCKLYELQLEKSDCDSDDQFFVKVNFLGKNVSTCFKAYVNNDLIGDFNYADLPINLGPFKGDCHTEYKFEFRDCEHPDCFVAKGIGKVCCEPSSEPCKLSELRIEKTDCLGDKQFYVFLNFNYQGVSECFRVKGNGHNYGEFRYGSLPIKIGPFTADCLTEYEFVVEDCVKHDCHIAANLGKVCCNDLNTKIYELEMIRSDCEPDSTFKVKFNFKYRDVSDSFNIFVNGKHTNTFAYSQVPVSIGPLLADCKTNYKIRLVDQKDTTIHVERGIERPCCHPNIDECKIFEIKAHPLHCTGPNQYALMLNFRYRGTTNTHFEVFDRNGLIGYFPFDSLPVVVTINNFKKTGRDYDYVKICENDNERCCAAVEFKTIECDSFTNNPKKFRITDLVINTNSATGRVSLFSALEIPGDIEIEMFNLEGRQVPVDVVELERQPHEIFISTSHLMTDIYFVRVKNQEGAKTYKFFHLR